LGEDDLATDESLRGEFRGGLRGEEELGEESREGETEGCLEVVQDEFGRVGGRGGVVLRRKTRLIRAEKGERKRGRTGMSLQRVTPVRRK
jgi:hypothetical protein